jgi:hypothetical protein
MKRISLALLLVVSLVGCSQEYDDDYEFDGDDEVIEVEQDDERPVIIESDDDEVEIDD